MPIEGDQVGHVRMGFNLQTYVGFAVSLRPKYFELGLDVTQFDHVRADDQTVDQEDQAAAGV